MRRAFPSIRTTTFARRVARPDGFTARVADRRRGLPARPHGSSARPVERASISRTVRCPRFPTQIASGSGPSAASVVCSSLRPGSGRRGSSSASGPGRSRGRCRARLRAGCVPGAPPSAAQRWPPRATRSVARERPKVSNTFRASGRSARRSHHRCCRRRRSDCRRRAWSDSRRRGRRRRPWHRRVDDRDRVRIHDHRRSAWPEPPRVASTTAAATAASNGYQRDEQQHSTTSEPRASRSGGAAGAPSVGSCCRIARSSSRSAGPGSIPSSSLERVTALAVDLERLGLAAGPVERRHQLRPQPLAERMLRDELA